MSRCIITPGAAVFQVDDPVKAGIVGSVKRWLGRALTLLAFVEAALLLAEMAIPVFAAKAVFDGLLQSRMAQ